MSATESIHNECKRLNSLALAEIEAMELTKSEEFQSENKFSVQKDDTTDNVEIDDILVNLSTSIHRDKYSPYITAMEKFLKIGDELEYRDVNKIYSALSYFLVLWKAFEIASKEPFAYPELKIVKRALIQEYSDTIFKVYRAIEKSCEKFDDCKMFVDYLKMDGRCEILNLDEC